ncbi:hypothetical protein F4780DRAFT_747309 [Xylariomycetidae sp. FL0641]|nr:hypothetical protein F4780DRAFT_747309 [Xylariomycetidae sp. FL0641]
MDHCASTLMAFPPPGGFTTDEAYEKAAKAHVTTICKLLREQGALLQEVGPQLLDLLDPAVHSLSYLALLHLQHPPTAHEHILEKVAVFLTTFDARQCRLAGTQLRELMSLVGTGQLLPASVAVEALATAILRLDPSGSILTSSHVLLAKLAYQTDNIQRARKVMDKNIVFYPGMAGQRPPQLLCDMALPPPAYISHQTGLTTVLTSTHVLEYDLLCGMSYCATREWAKARAAFERGLTFPTREGGCSKIMVEAYKKWVLTSLLAKGRLTDPPSYTGGMANKAFGTLGKHYTAVAALFETDNVEGLRQETENNRNIWAEDGNSGLVQEVLAAYQKWRVLGLQDIYTKISISEIRSQTTSGETGVPLPSDADAEMLVQNMIIEGMLSGVLEKNDDGVVFLTFLPSTAHRAAAQLSEQEFAAELARAALRIKQLAPVFAATNARLGASRDYIKHVIKEARRGEKGAADEHGQVDFHAQVDDEDLMGGIVATG